MGKGEVPRELLEIIGVHTSTLLCHIVLFCDFALRETNVTDPPPYDTLKARASHES